MNEERLIEIQTKRSAQSQKGGVVQKSFEQTVNDCREYIQVHTDFYSNKEGQQKTKAIGDLIVKFVYENKPVVEGFVDKDGTSDTNHLINRLIQDITDYGILAEAMADPSVFEIRINGKEVKIEKNGKCVDLTDGERVLSFESPEQQDIVFRKLMGDVRLTPKDAVVNARTIEGYRIAAVHHSALSKDPIDPRNDDYNAMVLRKFKKNKLNLGDIVKFKTMSDNMARTLALVMAGDLTFFTVGPTASGKTTTNQAILNSTPPSTRVVLLQNPSEIDLRFRDNNGRVYNDVLHLEAQEVERPLATSPTMDNLQAHILRLSPTYICFGELRSDMEFARGIEMGQAGHPYNCTFHAFDSNGAIKRYATAYNGVAKQEQAVAMGIVTSIVDLVIVQRIMKDGTRKVLQISEVLGCDPNDPTSALTNDLYKFITTHTVTDSSGNVLEMQGYHKRVGKISDKLCEKLKQNGVNTERFDFLLKDPFDNEEETYVGDNDSIVRYGLPEREGD